MSAVDLILGRKPKTAESTTTGSMPTVVGAPIGADPKKSVADRLAKLKNRKKPTVEDNQTLIPTDAVKDLEAEASLTDGGSTKPASPGDQKYLDTKIALVAPITTPGWDAPLDPSQVPAAFKVQSQQPAEPVPPVPAAEPKNEPSPQGGDALRTLIGKHVESFRPELISGAGIGQKIQAEPAAVSAVATEASAMMAKSKAAAMVAEAHSGKPSEHHFNPKSMDRLIAVTRMFA